VLPKYAVLDMRALKRYQLEGTGGVEAFSYRYSGVVDVVNRRSKFTLAMTSNNPATYSLMTGCGP